MADETEPRPLRGRRTELSTTRRVLATASEGRASAIALIGGPGIGKSRLATEAAALADRAGFTTRWGRAWEAGGAPAYWPWRQLCEGLPRDGAIAQLWGGHTGVGDSLRAEAARSEHEVLVKELSRAVGLRGKPRRAGAATERARVAAQRRLREAIKKIAELDAELGAHLDKAVRTGTFCVYRP